MAPTPYFRQISVGLALYVVLLLSWFALSPGLTGTFLFDDFPNLNGLQSISGDPSTSAVLQYILGGESSSLGRPLAMASFALQHASWPNNAADFIRVNILLHLLNGTLLFWNLLRLRTLAQPQLPGGHGLALAVTLLWLCAALQPDTVLYVVQRMALLSGTCMLLGLLLYLYGRQRAVEQRPGLGYAFMTAGLAIAVVLGTLSKENAALFPLMVLVLEATLLRNTPRPAHWRLWKNIFLVLPLVLLSAYLIVRWPGNVAAYAQREFTPVERLLTETRILFSYLYKLLVPTLGGVRLLYDDFEISHSLFQPWTTVVSVVAWLILGGVAYRRRKVGPLSSFAVLWFLACHALESTLLPLELVFDHRNYLAIIGPLLAVAASFPGWLRHPAAARLRTALTGIAAAYVALVVFACWQAATLWGQPLVLARYWIQRQPDSTRAYHQYTDILVRYGLPAEAINAYRIALQHWPRDPALLVSLMEIGCYHPELETVPVQAAQDAVKNPQGQILTTVNVLIRFLSTVEDGRCPRYPRLEVQDLMRAALESPSLQSQRHNLLIVNARITEYAGDRAKAARYLDAAVQLKPWVPNLQLGVVWAIEAGDVPRARRYLVIAETDPRIPAAHRWSYRKEIAGMKQLIELYQARAR